MLQRLRSIRNEQVHEASVDEPNPRDLEPILIGAMESLYKVHKQRIADKLEIVGTSGTLGVNVARDEKRFGKATQH